MSPFCSFNLEKELRGPLLAGIDEVGRGCLAGPVVVAGVVFPTELWSSRAAWIKKIDDSKKLQPEVRKELSILIQESALATSVVQVSEDEIDRINILQATWKGARAVISELEAKLAAPLDCILIDGPHAVPGVEKRQHPLIGGDRVSKTIAAASIIAKVFRDEFMERIADEYPAYGFKDHKGYATPAHRKAMKEFGMSPLHRKSFIGKEARQALGRQSEQMVADFLVGNGFQILERNWRVQRGEIDLIATREKALHFVEVRSRTQSVSVEMSFSRAKQNQFVSMAKFYLMKHNHFNHWPVHLHFMSVIESRIEPYWDVFKF